MCTYLTEKIAVEGSGKGATGWFTLTDVTVYLDHPQHAPAEHTLNIDFLNPSNGPSARVAVELTAESARALGRAIERVWGRWPLYTREGGSGPEEALGRVLDGPVLFLGVGLPGDRIHAPNERMVMAQFWRGLVAAGELLLELGGR